MQTPAPTGKHIKTFKHGKALPLFTGLFGAVLLAFAIFVLYLPTAHIITNTGPVSLQTSGGMTITFASQTTLLYATAALLAALAAVMLGLTLWQYTLRRASYDVHEHGITQVIGSQRDYTPFTEIQDLYLFSSGQTALTGLITNLAYRRDASEPFKRVTLQLKGFLAFVQWVRELYLRERLPVVLRTLEAGGAVTFNYISTGQVWGKRMGGNFLDIATQPISVTRDQLEVEGHTVSMVSLRGVDLNAWSEKVVIKGAVGKTVFAALATGIMSHDLMLATLSTLLQDGAAQGQVGADNVAELLRYGDETWFKAIK
ncbi:hypothetical protein PMM47T1_04139 [Pseudomonas sp. M47T1]|uniref:hypothetical protein n=1 Tax=unclassified Pseudomonas TaxID=196821 RepID=UPI000260781C|nr:hypothetical protein [Pseudomonas sp. M47T1]EIK97670.1 hypothetical protein PMM47T1_04139 [Pseudomonas sp. M47T1]